MSEIKQLTLSDFKEIYRNYVKNDFPLMEMRPWFAVERAFRRGTYSAYGYYEGEQLLAYAACYLFGVDYEIFYFPREEGESPLEDLFDTVCSLYQELYHPVYGKLCKPYIEG